MNKTYIYTKNVHIYISEEQKKKLDEYSEKTRICFSDIIRLALDEYFKNHPLEKE